MRAPRLLAAAALSALAAAPAAAAPDRDPSGAGELRLVEMSGQTSEKTLVEAFVPQAKGQPLESLLYDLDGDRNPEVVARLKGAGMCDETGKTCRTLVFRKEVAGWKLVLDRPTRRLDARGTGFGGMRTLVVDERETYQFTSDGYKFDFAASGKPIALKPAQASFLPALAAKFGLGAERLAVKGRGLAVKVATVEAKDGKPMILARLEGPGACGAVLGCPWRLLEVKDGAYVTVSDGFAGERMTLLPVVRQGYRDIAVQTRKGYDVYGWSGQRYGLAESRKEGSTR